MFRKIFNFKKLSRFNNFVKYKNFDYGFLGMPNVTNKTHKALDKTAIISFLPFFICAGFLYGFLFKFKIKNKIIIK